ncbi:MAG: hypothetical protein L6V93_16755 [Clostridiales bacterium]|nr:MAG: hypothetical protein L6V93_16755 [Clostridiales bacterium]
MICASEQSVIVLSDIYDKVKAEFAERGCFFLNREDTNKVRKTIIINGALNAKNRRSDGAHNSKSLRMLKFPRTRKIFNRRS